ncbi:Cof-type HAD-IIB family hydrolase [Heliorestis convoluta]|uniref:Cof-type HAD-IIB family hydrolase n=1 Tax=Heliorestis convoluta TaxID=356322 RepID=A0A5Q2MVM5_9FIRM|nr:Cof-type HAD-IIB family hydrolase [Heliorestis convoluta]QGG46208.1 Cof-type HAD-IIB family hydrolase [Heliorestis convoluta]
MIGSLNKIIDKEEEIASTEVRSKGISLVAIDVDDTLLTEELTILPAVKEAIQRAQQQGVTITLATGRMYRSTLPYAKELGLALPLIVYQGALIQDSQTGEVLWHRPVEKKLATEVLAFLQAKELHVNLYVKDHLYMEKLGQEGSDYIKLARVPVTLIPDHRALLAEEETTKILAIGDPEKLEKLEAEGRQLWGDQLFVTRSKPFYLEFMDRRAGKGEALGFLAEQLQIDQQNVMAIGDSYNDIDMLEYAGVAVAMGNGPREVQKSADYVAPTNREGGVATALERFVLKNF